MAIVLLSAVLIIGSSLLVSEQNLLLNGGTTASQSSSTILGTASQAIEKNATLALLSRVATGLQDGTVVNPNLTLVDQEVDSDVGSYVGTNFPMHFAASGSMPACKNAVIEDPFVVCISSWWVHVTFPSLHSEGLYPTVSEADPSSSAPVGPSAQNTYLATTPASVTPYPAVVGSIQLFAYQNTSGAFSEATFPFVESPQSALGLLESSAESFTNSVEGPEAEFTRLAQYILTTVGELNALEGVGGGPYGPSTSVASVLPSSDISLAGNLALLLTTLQSFRTYDTHATDAFGAGHSPLDSLVQKYVSNGTVDSAALFLFLMQSMGKSPTTATSQVGATLAQSVYSFVDRFTYDILYTYFGNYVVDPTLLEPVATWEDIWQQGASIVDQWAYARVTEYANDYANWLGVAICNPPVTNGGDPPVENSWACATHSLNAQSATGNLGPLESTAEVGCYVVPDSGGPPFIIYVPATYVMLPSTTLAINVPKVPTMDNLLVGNEASGGYSPDPFVFHTRLDISSFQGSPNYQLSHKFSYQLVDKSLLGEYTGSSYNGNYPANYTVTKIIQNLNQSMSEQYAQTKVSGYVDTIARAMAKMGPSANGLPTLTGSDVLNSSYSYLTQGSAAEYSTLWAATGYISSQNTPSNLDNWWVTGAEHVSGVGTGPSVHTTYSLSDTARLGARLWYMTYYNLYYGMNGDIDPTLPSGAPVQTSSAEDGLWVSPAAGKLPVPPAQYLYEPNFREDVQSATFDDIYAWMGSSEGSWNGGQGNLDWFLFAPGFQGSGAGPAQVDQECALYANAAASTFTGQDDCDQPYTCEPFLQASAMYYNDQQNLWSQVLGLVEQAGTPTIGSGNSQFSLITTSWNNIQHYTGKADWKGNSFSGAGGFIETYVDIPSLASGNPDPTSIYQNTGSLAEQWIPGIYESSQQWTENMASEQSLPYSPYLQRNMPYEYWQGTRSAALTDGSVESVPGLNLDSVSYYSESGTPGTLTYSLTQPQVCVHTVDPQDSSVNMGIAPFETTWDVFMGGTVRLTISDPQKELLEGGKLHNTTLTIEVPLRANFPVTIETPWPLQSNILQKTDPIPLETRGLLGLVVGHPATFSYDYKPLGSSPANWVFLPGDYVSPLLNKLLVALHGASIIAKNETADEAAMLSNLPDAGPDGGPALSLALSQDVQWDGLAYNSVAKYSSSVFLSLMGQIQGKLHLASGSMLTPVLALNYHTFFGDNMTSLNLQSHYANFQSGEGGTSVNSRSDVFEATESLTTNSITGTVEYDPGNANMTLRSMWKAPGSSWSLLGFWNQSGVTSRLDLTGPGHPISQQLWAYSPGLSSLLVPHDGYTASTASLYVGGAPSGLGTTQTELTKAYQNWMKTTSPTFDTYVTTEQYLAGYLFDCLQQSTGCTLPSQQWRWGTALQMPGGQLWSSTSVIFTPAGGITAANMDAFLLWDVSANRVMGYSLNESAPDYMALALMAQPQVGAPQAGWMSSSLLPSVGWNSTYGIGAFQPTPVALTDPAAAFNDPNFASMEADMGGLLDGGSSSAVVDLGGASSSTYTYQGSLSEQ